MTDKVQYVITHLRDSTGFWATLEHFKEGVFIKLGFDMWIRKEWVMGRANLKKQNNWNYEDTMQFHNVYIICYSFQSTCIYIISCNHHD